MKVTDILRDDISYTGIPVITADLEIGGRNTGNLIYLAREEAYKLASENTSQYVVVDAAVGIGCPVISSLAGADILIIVVEPSPS